MSLVKSELKVIMFFIVILMTKYLQRKDLKMDGFVQETWGI